MSTPAREMSAKEARLYREVERTEEARQAAQKRGRKVTPLSWSNTADYRKIVDEDGEWLRLKFVEPYEDKQGRTGWHEVECLILAKFRVIG